MVAAKANTMPILLTCSDPAVQVKKRCMSAWAIGHAVRLSLLVGSMTGLLDQVPLTAQVTLPVNISDQPLCPACRVEVHVVAQLGTIEGPGAIPGRPLSITVDGRGRYWALFSGDVPMVFERNGAFLARIGRMGRGPGEFQTPRHIMALPGDSVIVFEFASPASIIGPGLNVVRTIRMPPIGIHASAVIDWPHQLILHGMSPLPALFGWPFHILELGVEEGSVPRSFGTNGGELRPGQDYRLVERIAASRLRRGEIWSVEMLRYRITRWNSSAEVQAILERRPAWFPRPSNAQLGAGHDKPAEPMIQGIAEDSVGRLWVATLVASPDWLRLWKDVPRPTSITEVSADWGPPFQLLYRTNVEVIDPRANRLVAYGSIPHAVIATLPDNRLVAYSIEDGGIPRLSVLSLVLRSPR